MLNLTYIVSIWKMYRGLVIFGVVFIGLLQFLILWIFSSINYIPILEVVLNQLPPQIRMLIDQELLGRLSVKGMAAFGFNHPMVLLVLGLTAISMASRQIAGNVENGSLELLIAYPFKRSHLYFSLWFAILTVILVMIVGGLSGSLLTLVIKNLLTREMLNSLVQIALNLWILFALIMSYALLLSAYHREGGRVGILSAAITLIFYFLYFLASFWDQTTFLKPFNIFHYYQPQKIMSGTVNLEYNLLILLILTGLCLTLGIHRFRRRDIP